MISMIWRFFLAVVDWRTMLRILAGKPEVDVVFIANLRDEVDRKRFLGNRVPEYGNFNAARYRMNGISARVRFIDTVTEELKKPEGLRRAREQTIHAVAWARDHGAKIVALTASTKRLFGANALELKRLYPGIVFTNGDNGTAYLLVMEIFRAFKEAGLNNLSSRIAVLGPYGLLGEAVVEALTEAGYKVIGLGPKVSQLSRVKNKYGIETAEGFYKIGEVDAVVACVHSIEIRLKAESVEKIRRNGKKLLVIDVAEPANFSQNEYERCSGLTARQDAGNAYNQNLKYVLGAVSYRLGRLTRGVTFGCFAEAISLFSAMTRGEKISKIDWFEINKDNIGVVKRYYDFDGFTIPSPRNFGKPVTDFSLDLTPREQQIYPALGKWKTAFSRAMAMFL